MAFVICAGAAGQVGYSKVAFWAADDCYTVESALMNDRFLYHLLLNQQHKLLSQVRKASIPRLSRAAIEKLRIPVPPMEVQEEIVRVLDTLTELEAELEAKLEAELEARKAQYAYYSNKLLAPTNNCEWTTLGEVANIARGASPRPIKNFITDAESGIPWIKIGDVDPAGKYVLHTKEKVTEAGAAKSRYLSAGSFILSNSMSFGRPYILGIDGCIHDGWLSIQGFENSFLSDYLYHLLRSDTIQSYWQSKVNTSSVSNLNADLVKATPIPLPRLDEQRAVVELLDQFESFTNDLKSGLPAEIEARRKQYAYYRDRLLAFKEKKA